MIAGGKAYSNAHFGAGSGQIFLDDVQCTSSSSQLLECHSRPVLTHGCLHSADAGVGCEGSKLFYKRKGHEIQPNSNLDLNSSQMLLSTEPLELWHWSRVDGIYTVIGP